MFSSYLGVFCFEPSTLVTGSTDEYIRRFFFVFLTGSAVYRDESRFPIGIDLIVSYALFPVNGYFIGKLFLESSEAAFPE